MKLFNYLKICLLLLFFSGFGLMASAQKATITDADITDKIESEMTWQLDIPSQLIDVETKKGIVLLGGTVDNILAKERAVTLAGAVRGVRGVVDEIKVDPPKIANELLKDDIKYALFEDPAADSYEVDVKVTDGKVTLDGKVESWQEKSLTEYVAKSVKGVKSVQNNMVVNYKLQRPDNEIKREIEQSLLTDVRLYPNTVSVNVDKGNVKLSGYVGSVNSLDLASSYAWTLGTKSVDAEGVKIQNWADNPNMRKEPMPSLTDGEIKKAIVDAFLFDPRVLSFNPDVSVNNGIVTLSGAVDNLKAKKAAAADARNIVGVTIVKNNLKVRPAQIPSNSVLVRRVQSALERNPDVDRYDIMVSAWNGKVYLDGSVDTYFEKNRAEEVASNVQGVVNVLNNIDVFFTTDVDYLYPYSTGSNYYPSPYASPSQYYTYPLSDLQIKENIENELWWSPFVSEDDLEVEVSRGIATLSGSVDSWMEEQNAIENGYEGGAISVVDNITINYGVTN